jgi:hypothetical protein
MKKIIIAAIISLVYLPQAEAQLLKKMKEKAEQALPPALLPI